MITDHVVQAFAHAALSPDPDLAVAALMIARVEYPKLDAGPYLDQLDDIGSEAKLRVEAAGYPIILHVHDELVCEVLEGFGSLEEFTRLMTRKPPWALDLPIAANAWRDSRYVKGA